MLLSSKVRPVKAARFVVNFKPFVFDKFFSSSFAFAISSRAASFSLMQVVMGRSFGGSGCLGG